MNNPRTTTLLMGIVTLLLVMVCLAETAPSLPKVFKTVKGLEVVNGRIVGKTDNSIRVMHDGGIANINARDLPPDIASQLGFNTTVSPTDEFQIPDPLVTAKRTYHKTQLAGVDPDGIRIMHVEGSAKINYEDLSSVLIQAFGPFDPMKAASFRNRQKELQAIAYREAQEFKAAQNQTTAPSATATEVENNEDKQKLLENPSLISQSILVALSARSSGGKINTQTSDGVSSVKETASVRDITCAVQSQTTKPQRLRLQCLLLTRPAFVDGPLTPELAGETNVELGPNSGNSIRFTVEAVRTDETEKIGTLTTPNVVYSIQLRTRSGVKYIGWSIRAIDGQGRVCSVASSIPHYDRFSWQTPVN